MSMQEEDSIEHLVEHYVTQAQTCIDLIMLFNLHTNPMIVLMHTYVKCHVVTLMVKLLINIVPTHMISDTIRLVVIYTIDGVTDIFETIKPQTGLAHWDLREVFSYTRILSNTTQLSGMHRRDRTPIASAKHEFESVTLKSHQYT